MRAPSDVLEIFLQPGDFYFGRDKTRIRTLLGSCVAMTLWHPRLRIGGMCHYMLPRRAGGDRGAALDGRYADEAVDLLLREVRRHGTRPAQYHVKLFGGGRMFRDFGRRAACLDISGRNVAVGRELAARAGFGVVAEDLGGDGHRNLILDLWSGDVWVRRVPHAMLRDRKS